MVGVALVMVVTVDVTLEYSPTLPALALLFVVVPTIPLVWLGAMAPVALSVVKAPELGVVLPMGGGATSESALLEAAVTSPLALTVSEGICVDVPKVPTLEFTVAKVETRDPVGEVTSPESSS